MGRGAKKAPRAWALSKCQVDMKLGEWSSTEGALSQTYPERDFLHLDGW
jgi:hypothetical protein